MGKLVEAGNSEKSSFPKGPTPGGDLGSRVAFLWWCKRPIPGEDVPGPAGSERGPWSPTLRQRRRGSAGRAAQGPNGEKRGRGAPDPDPTPPPARKSKKPRGERGVSAETMKLGGAQTRRRACFLTTCQQRGEARLPTTAPRCCV